jgi:uncharacterized protein YraI
MFMRRLSVPLTAALLMTCALLAMGRGTVAAQTLSPVPTSVTTPVATDVTPTVTPTVAATFSTTVAQPAGPRQITVQANANLRAGPGTNFAIVGRAWPGQLLPALACNADCAWVQVAVDCWIAAFLVTPQPHALPLAIDSAPSLAATASLTIPATSVPPAIVQTTRCPQTNGPVNTFAGPGIFYPVVDTRPQGECVAVVARTQAGDWFQLSHGMWLPAAVVRYAEPLRSIPVVPGR